MSAATYASAEKPRTLDPSLASIPVRLTSRDQWLCWQWKRKDDGKWTKKPVNALTGQSGSSTDTTTWASCLTACAALKRGYAGPTPVDGVGFVFSADDPFTGIDGDGLIDQESGELHPDLIATMARFPTYWELSVRGGGAHAIVEGALPGKGRKEHPWEAYDQGRFFAMTGHRIGDYVEPQPCPELSDWYTEVFPEKTQQTTPPPPNDHHADDDDILLRCRSANNGSKFARYYDDGDLTGDTWSGEDASRADLALMSLMAFWTQDPAQLERLFSGSALGRREKWGRADYRKWTIDRALNRSEYYTPGPTITVNGTHRAGSNHQQGQAGAGGNVGDMPSDDDKCTGLSLSDFASYLPERKYIYRPTSKVWEPAGLNRAFPKSTPNAPSATDIVDVACPVHDLTWAPGQPQIVEDRFLDQGGWITKPGARVYNSYRPPRALDGDPSKAFPWTDHVHRLYPDNADHILDWLAHRVQRPDEKPNHALVLGGAPGIGKDTILQPVQDAIGPWNLGDVSPTVLMGRFNAFLKAVILRVSELRDLGDKDRFGFYEHSKTIIVAPPDTLLVDEKNIRAYRVPNLVGVIFTTNHRSDGLYLPADDRRHYVAWSDLQPTDFADNYWTTLYRWFDGAGAGHVAAFLRERNLSNFDPKAPPAKTPAFWDVVSASRAREDDELADAMDALGNPDAVTIGDVEQVSVDLDFKAWIKDRRNSRQIPHRFEACGYVAVQNPSSSDKRWKVNGKNQVIYAARTLSIRDRIEAARERSGRKW